MFQSTRPAKGATATSIQPPGFFLVSIHAPREGRDVHNRRITPIRFDVSIHAPREGRDLNGREFHCEYSRFQSTRPAKGAT